MAPWSSKGHTSNQAQPATPIFAAPPPYSPAERGSLRTTEHDPFDHHFRIPTLHGHSHHGQSAALDPSAAAGAAANPPASSSSELLTIPSRKSSSHSRSMSHPFPSLFSSKKKRNDGEQALGSVPDHSSPASTAKSSRATGSKEQLITGKCMTCDTTVKWPKDLSVYRCTVCMTVNDLKPLVKERPNVGTWSSSKGHPITGPSPPQWRVAPLSKERTRWHIDRCVTKFLTEYFQQKQVDTKSTEGFLAVPDSPAMPAQPPYPFPAPGLPIPVRNNNGPDRRDHNEYSMYSTSSPGELGSQTLRQSSSFDRDRPPPPGRLPPRPPKGSHDQDRQSFVDANQLTRHHHIKTIFRPLEDYVVESFTQHECINSSFMIARPSMAPRADSEGGKKGAPLEGYNKPPRSNTDISELDAKTLLLGDFAENGTWWTGGREFLDAPAPMRGQQKRRNPSVDGSWDYKQIVNAKSPRIDWFEMNEWYFTVLRAGNGWKKKLDDLIASDPTLAKFRRPTTDDLNEIQTIMLEAQNHIQRVLLKATENLLKRPGRPLVNPEDIRFLLIILANPLLSPSRAAQLNNHNHNQARVKQRTRRHPSMGQLTTSATQLTLDQRAREAISNGQAGQSRSGPGQHSGIIKRIVGLLSNLSNECHHHLVAWFARLPEGQFRMIMDLVGSFVTYRLSRQQSRKRADMVDPTAGLIPRFGAGPESNSSAALHAALGLTEQTAKKNKEREKTLIYGDDWQIKASARVMALLFAANNSGIGRRVEYRPGSLADSLRSPREKGIRQGQIVPTSDFYNSLLDYSELIVDFETWEAKKGKFTFCQYPFFLSIWAKIQIMEYDARRQMEVKAREAFFDSILTHKTFNQYLSLSVRRECLLEDSLKSVSEVVGAGGEEIKKGLKITFKGEEGIDAGGLRKEWFLLLVRDVFNPEHGLFVYDEDSQFCYFNPHTFETSDQFFLVGVVLGLAIYNSTILDVAFPPFAFRKLLAAGPAAAPSAATHAKPVMTYTLEDLAEFRPALANGLRQLLEFEGDVEDTFCRNFVADVDRYGHIYQVPLCADGETRPVTNNNRREFVDLYVRYLLDTAVSRQFEPFKRGFFTVCGGNALSLFRPEEIELLIRGSDEPLDISSLRAVAVCDNWDRPDAADNEPVIQWFWETFAAATVQNQRKMLSFITGSDRIPAMGATNLVIKLTCLGEDGPRYPVARTCFNMLSLYRYNSKAKLEQMLWRAVEESEGFGLK